ncbi:MAG: 2-hydroxyacyl-CoA dehydratase subunit D [Anaerolineae bacterium]
MSAAGMPPRIGYLCSYLPRELLHALGLLPVRVLPEWGIDASASEAYLPKNFCALSKAIFASLLGGNSRELDAVLFLDSCDAMRRLCDVWRRYAETRVLGCLHLPRRSDTRASAYYATVLADFAAECERSFGVPLTAEALASSFAIYDEQRHLLRSLDEARARGQITALSCHDACRAALTRDPKMANEELAALIEELQPPAEEQRPRLLLMGSLFQNRELLTLLDEHCALVVAEDDCTGGRQPESPLPASGTIADMLLALAGHYLSKPPCPRMRDLGRRLAHLRALVAERRVEGVICSYYKFCDLALAEFPVLKALARPLLLLEDEGGSELSGQARTRVEAFLETLQ